MLIRTRNRNRIAIYQFHPLSFVLCPSSWGVKKSRPCRIKVLTYSFADWIITPLFFRLSVWFDFAHHPERSRGVGGPLVRAEPAVAWKARRVQACPTDEPFGRRGSLARPMALPWLAGNWLIWLIG
jgi:hypothetical protein